MKTLIHTTTELQQFIKVDSTFVISTLFPFQETAIDKFLRDSLGDVLTDTLIDYYNYSGPEPVEPIDYSVLDNLLPYAQRIVAKFSFFAAAPNFDLRLTDSGFAVVSSQNLAPASRDRVNRFVKSLEVDGWDAVEMLLRFLEKNVEDYPAWKESPAYTMQLRNFINSADVFDSFVNIGKSRLTFKNFRNKMDDVEILLIEPVISKPLANTIRAEIKNNTLSEPNKVLLPVLQRAVANLVAANELDPKFRLTADHYLAKLRLMLDATPELYPEYFTSIYVAEKTYAPYDNTEDSSFFVAGS